MATIDAALIKTLREQTGAGVMDCKQALADADGNLDQAVKLLRQRGVALAAKKADRATKNGVISAYIHGGRIGVLVEVNCETDFVARNERFQELVHAVGLQIAAMNPKYLAREEVSPEVVEGEPEQFYARLCLLHQPYIKDESKTIRDLVTETIAATGENIVVRRFTRYELGEPTS